MVEAGHKHHKKGNLFHVRIDLTIPGHEMVVNKEPSQHHSYTDVYVAVRDAFDNVQHQLEHYVEQKRGDVKRHETPLHGHILELNPDEGFGRIETPDGRIIYFHRNSLIDIGFDKLKIGTEVRFDEEQGNLGPQASTVKIVGKHHLIG
jgi:cold shock CspA family protein